MQFALTAKPLGLAYEYDPSKVIILACPGHGDIKFALPKKYKKKNDFGARMETGDIKIECLDPLVLILCRQIQDGRP